MTKLDETLAEREKCRATLIELRAKLTDQERLAKSVSANMVEYVAMIRREQHRLIELTTQANKLLHADLAGLVPHAKDPGEPSQLASPEATPAA